MFKYLEVSATRRWSTARTYGNNKPRDQPQLLGFGFPWKYSPENVPCGVCFWRFGEFHFDTANVRTLDRFIFPKERQDTSYCILGYESTYLSGQNIDLYCILGCRYVYTYISKEYDGCMGSIDVDRLQINSGTVSRDREKDRSTFGADSTFCTRSCSNFRDLRNIMVCS